jgi:hypothetical protein
MTSAVIFRSRSRRGIAGVAQYGGMKANDAKRLVLSVHDQGDGHVGAVLESGPRQATSPQR